MSELPNISLDENYLNLVEKTVYEFRNKEIEFRVGIPVLKAFVVNEPVRWDFSSSIERVLFDRLKSTLESNVDYKYSYEESTVDIKQFKGLNYRKISINKTSLYQTKKSLERVDFLFISTDIKKPIQSVKNIHTLRLGISDETLIDQKEYEDLQLPVLTRMRKR